jgi:hypothetical protein
MAKKAPFKLALDDTVVTAWGENCAGPGWSNWPAWVLIRERSGKLRIECIQPEEQSAAMVSVFPFSAQAAVSMRAAVEKLLRPVKE